MDLILVNDGLYQLVAVTKEMTAGISLLAEVDCFDLCDILRLHLATYYDAPYNVHVMNDGSGDMMGCICNYIVVFSLQSNAVNISNSSIDFVSNVFNN